jgi:hypothetical protein
MPTHHSAYISSCATGDDGVSFLIACPGWNGEKPEAIKAVMRSETDFVLAWYRTPYISHPIACFRIDDREGATK